MALIKTSYPSTDTVALTITLTSLASDANLLAGRQTTTVDNTTNLDLDATVSGRIRVGTLPTSGNQILVYAFAPRKVVTSVATYPDVLGGLDAAVSITSTNVRNNFLKLVAALTVDATTGRDYDLPPTSIASLFGSLPLRWGLWVVHNTGVALDATATNHELHYTRIQAQTV